MAIERDTRPIHDQIIDHDLVGMSPDRIAALTLIELRRIRVQLADILEATDRTRSPLWPKYVKYCEETGPNAVSFPEWRLTQDG